MFLCALPIIQTGHVERDSKVQRGLEVSDGTHHSMQKNGEEAVARKLHVAWCFLYALPIIQTADVAVAAAGSNDEDGSAAVVHSQEDNTLYD